MPIFWVSALKKQVSPTITIKHKNIEFAMRNFLLIFCCFFAQTTVWSQTEIPNASFEDWTSATNYDNPNNWTTLNVLAALGAPAVASKSTDAVSGNFALKLETVSFFGNKIPGLCYLGEYEINLLDPASGTLFGKPFTGRPSRLVGAYKYVPVGNDVGGVSLQLWRTNPATGKRDTIGQATLTAETTTGYQNFDLPIEYTATDAPDSISIVIVSSANEGQYQVGSAIYVDDLQLVYDPLGINTSDALAASVYPNPATNQLHIIAQQIGINGSQLLLYDVVGKLVLQQALSNDDTMVSVANLPAGVYWYVLQSPNSNFKTGKVFIEPQR